MKQGKTPQQPPVKIWTHLVRLQQLCCYFFLKVCQNLVLAVLSEFLPQHQVRHARVRLSLLTLQSFTHNWNSTAFSATEFPGICSVPPNVHSTKVFFPKLLFILPYPQTSFSSQTWVLRGFMLPKQNFSLELLYFLPSGHFLIAPAYFLSIFNFILLYPSQIHSYWPPWVLISAFLLGCCVCKTPKFRWCSAPKQHHTICFWHGFQRF